MFKMSRSYQRPENALKRANEFIDVGKPIRALEVLYEVIKRGKMRSSYSEKLLEPIMYKYLELCVDLKKSHLAKEGLFQYRNIFQSVNVSSLETVVKFYLQLADDRTESARKESHQAVIDIDDLDNLATPEEILLSAVSGEDAQDRSDRTILTPWVKFLWESYRQCLELLRTNSRVEKLYHNIAQHAFKFCEKYSRKTEFRKLCDNLRTHLSHIQKQQGSATAVNLNNPETQQLNLETRLEQLNYAIKMELWQEAYKAIEDISDLMKKSKKMPKPHVMASYYEKLALVFWKAGNHLFHAAALFKLFQLLRDLKKNITSEEISKRASIVLVATLAIPLPSSHPEYDRFIETEKSTLEKIDKLANLLSLSKPPTRVSLIKDLVRLNVVNTVPEQLQNMYQLMEVEFDPLYLCSRMQVYLDWISERKESGLPQYTLALQEITITRLVKQIAQIYQTVTFKRLLELSVFMTPFHLERVLVDLVRHNDLQIRIDHRTNCIHFGVDLSESQREDLPEGPTLQKLPSETIRCQLVHMSSALQKCLALIAPQKKKIEMEPMRAQTIQFYKQTREREHQRILQRQHIIEERKEKLENQNLEREELLRKAQEETLKRLKEEEQERLRREASKREKERQEEQLKQIHTKQIKDKLLQISKTSYGQKMIEKIDKEELLNLGAEEILQRQVEELEKERKELQKKLKAQEKNVDYYERARRLIEIPRLKKALEVQKVKDREFWETQEEERVKKQIEEHRVALENSQRLERMKPDKDAFVEKLTSTRRSEIQKNLNDFNARLEVERKNRLLERKDQRRRDRREAYFRQKEEEEQTRRDEEMKKQREEEERLELERSKQEEEERAARMKRGAERAEEQLNHMNNNGEVDRSGPWRPKRASAWRQKEQDKLDVWRLKDDEQERESVSDRLSSRDIRRDEPPKERINKDDDTWRERKPPAKDEPPRKEERDDWRAGPPRSLPNRDGERGPPRDNEKEIERGPTSDYDGPSRDRDGDLGRAPARDIETEKAPRDNDRDYEREQPRDRDRDLERGPSRDKDRDFEKGPPRDRDRNFERGPPRDRDRDFERGPPRDKDRDFERGPPRDRDRDFERGPPRDRDRDFERGPPRDRDRNFERGPPRDRDRDFERGPPRDRDRDFERGPPRDRDRDFERGPPRDRDRDFERGPPRDRDRDFERGPPRDRDRDFERGPPRDRDRDFERGPPRDRDRDFERGPPRDRDRDFQRGPPRDRDRDIERGPPRDRDRDFERGPPRDRDFVRGPPRDFDRGPRGDRDFERGPPRDFERGPPRDRDRDGGRFRDRDDERKPSSRADEETSWRRSEPVPEAKRESFRRDDRREEGRGEQRKGFNAWRMGPPSERDEGRRGPPSERDEGRRGLPSERDEGRRGPPPEREEGRRGPPPPDRDERRRRPPSNERDESRREGGPKRGEDPKSQQKEKAPKRPPKEETDEDGWTTVRR